MLRFSVLQTSGAVFYCSSPPPLSPTPTSSRGYDRQLRQMFDITADVRILLHRVDDPSARHPVSTLNFCNLFGSLPLRGEARKERSAATTAHVPCLHSSRNSITCTVGKATSFVEPIEDDFLSDYENQGHDGTWQPTSSTTRGGRTRKRPKCPCCIPSSEVPAAKARWSEAEPAAARKNLKANRQKTDRKMLDSE